MYASDIQDALGSLGPKLDRFCRALDEAEREVLLGILALAQRAADGADDIGAINRSYVSEPQPLSINAALPYSVESILAQLPKREPRNH